MVYARISWGNAPATWAQCDALLTQQWALATQYDIDDYDAQLLFIEALFYYPKGGEQAEGVECLMASSSARFKTNIFLTWCKKNAEEQNYGL
ncbi:hypothetical protein PCNPT3_08335 [Psychromonas sp. CNPT3]|nr:hypothetical protein PCNPT3_08335 [Psychromonas sp. CNPT3]